MKCAPNHTLLPFLIQLHCNCQSVWVDFNDCFKIVVYLGSGKPMDQLSWRDPISTPGEK